MMGIEHTKVRQLIKNQRQKERKVEKLIFFPDLMRC
jgi:hypothetical protein